MRSLARSADGLLMKFMLGQKGQLNFKTMEQLQVQSQFTIKQREKFARLLEQAKEQAEAELPDESTVQAEAEAELVPKLLQEQGAFELAAKCQTLQKELKDSEENLACLGFSCDSDGDISLKWNPPKPLKDALKAAKREARAERSGQLKKYDRAILKVWAARTPEEAQKVVEDLLQE